MYEKTVDDVQLNECLVKENYLEATQMLIKEIKTNRENHPEIFMLEDIYISIMGVSNRSGMAAKSVYDLVHSMREVLLSS
jgi:hypothetical protein